MFDWKIYLVCGGKEELINSSYSALELMDDAWEEAERAAGEYVAADLKDTYERGLVEWAELPRIQSLELTAADADGFTGGLWDDEWETWFMGEREPEDSLWREMYMETDAQNPRARDCKPNHEDVDADWIRERRSDGGYGGTIGAAGEGMYENERRYRLTKTREIAGRITPANRTQ